MAAPAFAGPRRSGRSYLADITGQREPRSTVARPVPKTSSAPASTATRHGVPFMTACPAAPATTTVAPPDEPLVVDPAVPETAADSGEPTWLAATLTTLAAVTVVVTAAPAPAPNSASSTPAACRSTPRVAITAARPASAATASAPARGTRSAPDTSITCGVSGLGGVKTACAQRCLTASRISPAPTAPASSARPYSRLLTAVPDCSS